MRLKFPLYFALFKWFLFEWRTWTGSRHLPDALFQSLCYFPPHWLQKQHTIYSYWFQSCPTSTDFLHYQRNNIIKTQIFQLFPNLNIFSDFQEKTGSLAWHQFFFLNGYLPSTVMSAWCFPLRLTVHKSGNLLYTSVLLQRLSPLLHCCTSFSLTPFSPLRAIFLARASLN